MTVTTLYVSKDAYTRIKAPDTNYGSATSLQIRYLLNTSDTSNGYIEFDLTSIPDSQYVSSATLRLRWLGGGVGDTMYLKSLNAQFTENTITWNNAPATNSDWSSSVNISGLTWDEVSVDINWVQSRLSPNWLGIQLSALGYDDGALSSKEYSSGVYKAELVITYSTSPPSIGMKINIGDSWKNVPSMKINIGDSWKEVVGVKQNIGDVWKTVF